MSPWGTMRWRTTQRRAGVPYQEFQTSSSRSGTVAAKGRCRKATLGSKSQPWRIRGGRSTINTLRGLRFTIREARLPAPAPSLRERCIARDEVINPCTDTFNEHRLQRNGWQTHMQIQTACVLRFISTFFFHFSPLAIWTDGEQFLARPWREPHLFYTALDS